MKFFFDASAFLKVFKGEEGCEKVVEMLREIANDRNSGYTDSIAIAEIVYAFLSRGLDDEGVRARAYIEDIPGLKIIEEITNPLSHRGAELKRKYYRGPGRTSFSLYDGIHLAIAERYCDVVVTSDRDFEGVTEVEIEFV